MDNGHLRDLVAAGLSRVAEKIGFSVTQYRPENVMSPMGSVYAQTTAFFAADPELRSGVLSRPGTPYVYGAFETTDVVSGDIFSAENETWFVCTNDCLASCLSVTCNHTISLYSSATSSGSSTLLASGWPVAILMKSRGDHSKSGTPGAITPGAYVMYAPVLGELSLLPYMSVETEDGLIYTIDTVEVSRFGWRALLSMQQV